MQLIEALMKNLHDAYVLPEVTPRFEAHLRAHMAEYAAITDGKELSRRLTADLREVSGDKHLEVMYTAEPLPPAQEPGEPTAEQRKVWDLGILLDNGGVHKVERMRGNVGYLELRRFAVPEVAGEIAAAAMALLSGTEALIIDLRNNGGGAATMVAMLCSYFFRWYTHLNTIQWREGDRSNQVWTLPHVPGKRYLEKPV